MPADYIAFDGFEVRVDLDRWPAKILRALLRRHYEKHELRLVSRLLDPADRVVELGSAIGVVALAASRIVPADRIACFDANPDMVAEAEANFAHNGKPITVANAVLVPDDSAPSSVTFYKTPYFLSSSLSADTAGARPIEVRTLPLGEAISERRANVLIVDIEGGEFELLRTADLAAIDKLILELHVSMAGVDACIGLISDLERRGLALDRNLTGHNVFVFTRAADEQKSKTDGREFARAYLTALERSDAGDRAGAIEAAARATSANPANAHAHLLLSQLLTAQAPADRALRPALAAAERDPRNEDALEQLGILHSAGGADGDAERAYAQAIACAPNRPLFHAGLGAVLARQGRFDDARAAFEAAVRLCPTRATTLEFLAALAVRQDKHGDAPADQSAHIADPQRFLEALAPIIAGSFRFPDAAGAARHALALAPDSRSLQCGLAALVATPKDIRKATSACRN